MVTPSRFLSSGTERDRRHGVGVVIMHRSKKIIEEKGLSIDINPPAVSKHGMIFITDIRRPKGSYFGAVNIEVIIGQNIPTH